MDLLDSEHFTDGGSADEPLGYNWWGSLQQDH